MGFLKKLFGKKEEPVKPVEPVEEVRVEGKRIWGNYRTYQLTKKDEETLEDSIASMDIPNTLRTSFEEGMVFALGGANYHGARPYELYVGKTVFDKENKHDKKAVALCKLDGSLLGYILKTEQKDYYKQSNNTDNLPFVAMTYVHNDKIQGDCIILKDMNESGDYLVSDVLLKSMKILASRMMWIEDNGIY